MDLHSNHIATGYIYIIYTECIFFSNLMYYTIKDFQGNQKDVGMLDANKVNKQGNNCIR